MKSLACRAAILLVVVAGLAGNARAQAPAQLVAVQPGWSFSLAPYLWLPDINTNLTYARFGERLPTDVSIGPGEIFSGLHFALQGAAEARYDRFSILTDFIYLDTSGGRSRFREIDTAGALPDYVTPSLQSGTSVTLKAKIWTQSGGYTVLAGDWGNLDLLAGFRLLVLSIKTDYGFGGVLTGPLGENAGLGRFGSLSRSGDIWNGIAGFRGSLRLGASSFFVPYYFDIGGGGSHPTWQVASGIGYQGGSWWAVSATYRALAFDQSSRAVAAHVGIHGPMVMASFRF